MTIQEAQESSREHGLIQRDDGDDIMLTQTRYDAIGVIEDALDNGYQLCKVDEVIEKTQHLAKDIHSDCANACAYEFSQILEEACK